MNRFNFCCKKDQEKLKKLHVFKRYPKIKEATRPSVVLWQNLGYSQAYRMCMILLNWLIALAMISIALVIIVYFKNQEMQLKNQYKIDIVCPK